MMRSATICLGILISFGLVADGRSAANFHPYMASEGGYNIQDNQNGDQSDPLFNYNSIDPSENGGGTTITTWNWDLGNDDGWAGPFDLGFTFFFYGSVYTQCYVSSNGFISFTGGTGTNNVSEFENDPIPTGAFQPDNFIAAFWDDLVPSGGTTGSFEVFYKSEGGSGNKRFVVQWKNCGHFNDENDIYDFNMTLYEGGSGILFQYNQMENSGSGSYDTGSSASIGVEDASGLQGAAYTNNGTPNFVSEGLAVGFLPTTASVAPWPTSGNPSGPSGPIFNPGDGPIIYEGYDYKPSADDSENDEDHSSSCGGSIVLADRLGMVPTSLGLLLLIAASLLFVRRKL